VLKKKRIELGTNEQAAQVRIPVRLANIVGEVVFSCNLAWGHKVYPHLGASAGIAKAQTQ
jgi:hypothetical protein